LLATQQSDKSQKRRNLTNSAWGVFDYVAQAISLLLLTPLLLSNLGDGAYGILVIGMTVMGMNGMFSLGLGPATQHFVAKYRQSEEGQEKKRRLKLVVETSLITNVVFGILTGVLVFVLVNTLPSFFTNSSGGMSELILSVVKIASLGLPLVFITTTVDNALQGYERFDLSVPLLVGTRIITTVSQLILLVLGYGLVELISVVVLCKVLQSCIGIVLLKGSVLPELSLLRPEFSYAELRKFFSFGVFAWISSLLAAARSSGEVLALAAILGPTVLTLYVIPSRVLSQTNMLLARAFAFLFPFATKLIQEGRTERVLEVYTSGTRYLCTLSSFAIPTLAVGCGPFLAAWIGQERAELIQPVFQILAVRFAVLPLSILTTNLLMAAHKTHVITIDLALTSLFVLPSSAVLAYYFGVEGAAVAQLFVFVPILFIRYYVEKSLFGVASWSTVALPLVVSVVPLTFFLLLIQFPANYPLLPTLLASLGVGLTCGLLSWFLTAIIAPVEHSKVQLQPRNSLG